jgi:hypothetical protein
LTKIDLDFENRLRKNLQDTVRVIVRIAAEAPEIEARLQELDATVLYRFSLLRAVAISCTAETALALLQEPWVEAVEEDRPVFAQAFGPEPPSTGGNDE